MNSERKLSCVVCGSFKFKPEIDLAIEELQNYGVNVLAPEKGWLSIAPTMNFVRQEFRPLPSEKNITLRQVEDNFLRRLTHSDFVYIVNIEGYVGKSSSLEIGVAIAASIPIYSKYQINTLLDNDLEWEKRTDQFVKVRTIKEIILELN